MRTYRRPCRDGILGQLPVTHARHLDGIREGTRAQQRT
jgi:hypothetical protein